MGPYKVLNKDEFQSKRPDKGSSIPMRPGIQCPGRLLVSHTTPPGIPSPWLPGSQVWPSDRAQTKELHPQVIGGAPERGLNGITLAGMHP